MNAGLEKLGEILLLVYGLLISIYIGWWGYILIIGRYDLIEKWWQLQPKWARKLFRPLVKLPESLETLVLKVWGLIFLICSLVFFVGFCVLLIRSLLDLLHR